jgi:ribonuclease Z
VSGRELIVLGTAAQVPTRDRAHQAALLRWDGEGFLFDPGEGAQRQLLHAGVPASAITRVCITHFHGDHCLGLPGIMQRLSLDRVTHPVDVYFPAGGEPYFDRLRSAAAFHETTPLRPHPCRPGTVATEAALTVSARPLRHRIETLGWRVEEPDGRTMLPERLDAIGVRGPDISRLQAEGAIEIGGRTVTLAETSVPRPGQSFAFVMDTAFCDEAVALAAGADLVVCEATFLSADADLARAYGHLTAAQAARIAAEAGARRLVLTHFSQRYPDTEAFAAEARAVFDDVVAARDLLRVPLPPRRRPRPAPG